MTLTPEREKYLRSRIDGEESIGWDGVKDLLAEIDKLRTVKKIVNDYVTGYIEHCVDKAWERNR